MNPITREEQFMAYAAGQGNPNLTPITRKEMFLAKAGGASVETPTPITREEMFLSQISGGGGGGSGDSDGLNIAYGDTAPEDTTKLWVKTSEPSKVTASTIPAFTTFESLETLTGLSFPSSSCGVVNCAYALYGDCVYYFGGRYGVNLYSEIYKLDLKTNTFTRVGYLPTSTEFACATVKGDIIYIFGGRASATNELDRICVFDTKTETISTPDHYLASRTVGASSVTVNDKVYVIGGNSRNQIAIYEGDGSWSTGTSLPFALTQMACVAVGKYIYIFGGLSGGAKDTILLYDTETKAIDTLEATLPKKLYMLCASALDSRIFIIGGTTDLGANYRNTEVYVFDTQTQTIATTSLTAHFAVGASCFTYNDKIYIGGGCLYWQSTEPLAKDSTRSFKEIVSEVDFDLMNNEMFILLNESKNPCKLINSPIGSLECGVSEVYKGNADNEGERVEALLYQNDTWVTI